MGKFKLFTSVYLMIFLLAFISHFMSTHASYSYPSRSGYGSGSGYYSDSSYSSKSKSNAVLRDNNVEDIKRDSIHRHLMFAVNRMTALYLSPVIDTIWTIFSPVFEMMWKCCSYLNDFMWNNVYDTGYWLYVNMLYPVLVTIQENIYYILQITSNALSDLYTNFIKPAVSWCFDVFYDYIYSSVMNVWQVIWNNISRFLSASWDWFVCIASSALDFCCTYFWKIYGAIQESISHIIQITFNALSALYTNFIKPTVMWSIDAVYNFLYSPAIDFMQIICNNISRFLSCSWDYVISIASSILNFCNTCFWTIFDAFCCGWSQIWDACYYGLDTFGYMTLRLYDGIIDSIIWCGNKSYHYVLKPCGRLLVKIWTSYIKFALNSIYQFFAEICDKMSEPIIYIVDNICLPAMQKLKTFLKSIGNFMLQNVLEPLGNFVDTIWTDYICKGAEIIGQYLRKIFAKVRDILYLVIRNIFKVIWHILCFIGRSIFAVWDTIHRYLVEINVTKLKLPKNNAKSSASKPSIDNNGYLNNYEIGVYYGTLGEKKKFQTVYLTDQQVTDGYVYLWLRNNAKHKRANAKITVYDNNSTIHEKTVRLNKKESHAVSIKRDVFRNKQKNCRKVKVEFMLENVSQTSTDQSNRRVSANDNNNNNNNNDNNNNNEGTRNVQVGGDGATYIAVDKKTKCRHQFLLCYQ